MTSYFDSINASKIAIGLSTIGMQLGARYVVGDLTMMQNKILASKVAKRIIMALMIFVATRDIMMSIILTIAIHAILAWLFNENSRMCIVPSSYIPDPNKDEYNAALAIVKKYESSTMTNTASNIKKRVKPPRLFPPMVTNSFY